MIAGKRQKFLILFMGIGINTDFRSFVQWFRDVEGVKLEHLVESGRVLMRYQTQLVDSVVNRAFPIAVKSGGKTHIGLATQVIPQITSLTGNALAGIS